MNKHGLKDREIRELINHVYKGIEKQLKFYKLPQCLRRIVHDLVLEFLTENNLRI